MSAMARAIFEAGPHSPLRDDEQQLVRDVLDALAAGAEPDPLAAAIVDQARRLDLFGELLALYPSPLDEQRLGSRRRGLDTLVEALSGPDHLALSFRAPTQAIIGRALNLAQINFFRLVWHVCGDLHDRAVRASLRERAARQLRTGVYAQLVEEVLSDLATDPALRRELRAEAVRQLAQLWGHRLTFRVSEFLPILEATWEARARVRVIGGTLLGTSEMFQLLVQGADWRFVELFADRAHGAEEAQAFREFLFGRSSEELEALTLRMAEQRLTSIEFDIRSTEADRDAGSIYYEFFQTRAARSQARRITNIPGPKRTAEGYVVLAWLEREGG
jgi:hypothetical protein